jgi:hypothetical protein
MVVVMVLVADLNVIISGAPYTTLLDLSRSYLCQDQQIMSRNYVGATMSILDAQKYFSIKFYAISNSGTPSDPVLVQ